MSKEWVIEMFPAGNGDAILIDSGDDLLLVDAGFTSTYRDHLKPRLKQLANKGRHLSKFIVTHIDADHISGAIAFIKDNGFANDPSVIHIDDIWFNSYRHLYFADKSPGSHLDDRPPIQISGGMTSEEAEDPEQLVSYPQGTSLGSQILKYGYNWNGYFKGLAVVADQPKQIPLSGNTTLVLLGPTKEALDKLADKWYIYLKSKFSGKIDEDAFFDDAFERMMEELRQAELASMTSADEERLVSGGRDWVEDKSVPWNDEDTSVTNGSSITFLLQEGNKKVLFLGDAIPTPVVDQLKKYVAPQHLPLEVDILKVAHHGAWSNNSPELLGSIRAKHYLFSSNGSKHHHPHYETMAWILKKHGAGHLKSLVFNYIQWNRLEDVYDPYMKNLYNYRVIVPDVDEWGNGLDGYVKIKLPRD